MDIFMIGQAASFAALAHRNQKRKYTAEPYFAHCARVAGIVRDYTQNNVVAVAAAYLHDVVEDVELSIMKEAYSSLHGSYCIPAGLADTREDRLVFLQAVFPEEVVALVDEVTDISKLSDGNRKTRKAMDRDHIAAASALGKTLKLADLIDNTMDIVANDPEFAKVYLNEKEQLLQVLESPLVPSALYQRAYILLHQSFTKLNGTNV